MKTYSVARSHELQCDDSPHEIPVSEVVAFPLLKSSVGLAAVWIATLQVTEAVAADWDAKHIQRNRPNLVSNPNFDGTSHWRLDLGGSGSVYDSTVTRTADGSGSIKLLDGDDTVDTAGLADFVPVTPGKTYTISAYTKTTSAKNLPTPIVVLGFSYRDSKGIPVTDTEGSGRTTSRFGRLFGNSVPGEWEEMTALINPPPGATFIDVEISMYNSIKQGSKNLPVDREAWVDDVYLGEGIGFEQAPTPKTAFKGSRTRVDELGNMEVKKSGSWKPFFPLAIYADSNRPDWKDYARQGFNMNMWANRGIGIGGVQRAKEAGMVSGVDISRFMLADHKHYADMKNLRFRMNEIKSEGVLEDVVLYYWDNEAAWDEWAVPERMTDELKRLDVDENGDRMHPIYALNGNIGAARRHLTNQSNPSATRTHLSDLTGTYIGFDGGTSDLNASGRTGHFRVLDNLQHQRQPVVFAQINRGEGSEDVEMRPRLFGAIAHGARGMGFWRDEFGGSRDVTKQSWWADFPKLAAEIDQMMNAGLIQQPHWTEWSITTTTNGIDFGTRDLNGEGYLIAANYNDSPTTATFTFNGLDYTPVEIRDFFTDAVLPKLSGNQYNVDLGANGSGVFRFVRP